MKYLTSIALIATLTGALAMNAPAEAQTRWNRARECRYQGVDGRMGFTRHEAKRTIRCVSHKFDVSTSEALYVADRESDYLEWVTNSSSGACGIFQHIPRYFLGRLRAVPNRYKPFQDSCYNARANIFAALYMAKTSGWGAWTTA